MRNTDCPGIPKTQDFSFKSKITYFITVIYYQDCIYVNSRYFKPDQRDLNAAFN